MTFTWRGELIHWALLAGMFATAALAWPFVPDRIAIHWNLQGEPDGYGGKLTGLGLFPLLTLGLYLMLLVIPRLDPRSANYASFATAYNVIRLSLTLFMATIYGVLVLVALGYHLDVGAIISIAVGLLIIVMGNFMGKIQPNWFVGVRTPWTLSSKLSWNKTHRLAGWLFIPLGMLIAASGVSRSAWMLTLTIAMGGISIAWMFLYSYLVWRKDPERIPSGGSPTPQ